MITRCTLFKLPYIKSCQFELNSNGIVYRESAFGLKFQFSIRFFEKNHSN